MGKLIVRRATKADLEAFSDMENKPTLRAWVGDLDGEIIAIGGLAVFKGRYYAFIDLKPEARQFKIHIMRSAKRMLAEAKRSGIKYIYAECSPVEPKASAWLARLGFRLSHLGFKFDPTSQLYCWSASESNA